MKVFFDDGMLKNALQNVLWAKGKVQNWRNPGIFISAEESMVQISATDSENVWVRVKLNDGFTVVESGVVFISDDRFESVVSQLSGEITLLANISGNNKFVGLAAPGSEVGNVAIRFPVLDPDSFYFPPPVEGSIFSVDALSFAEALRKVSIATGNDFTRPALMGILLDVREDGIRVVATDGYRLAMTELNATCESTGKYVIPKKIVRGIAILSGRISVGKTKEMLYFSAADKQIAATTICSNYPDYEMAFPEQFVCTVRVERDSLLRALRLVSIVDSKEPIVSFNVFNGELQFVADSIDSTASCTIKIDTKDQIHCRLNAKYVMDALHVMSDKEVTLKFSGEVTPLVLEAKSFTYLLMPVVK